MNHLVFDRSLCADDIQRFGELFDPLHAGVASFEVRSPRCFVLEYHNSIASHLLGIPLGQGKGAAIHELLSPNRGEMLGRALQRTLETNGPLTLEQRWPIGLSSRWFLLSAVPIRHPGHPPHRLVVLWQDIEDRKAFEQTLCQREEMYRHLVETTSIIPWEMDTPTQRFTYVGPQVVRRFGYPQSEWYQPGFWARHIHPDDRDRAVQTFATLAGAASEHAFEYRMLTATGEVVWIRDLISVVIDAQGRTLLRGFLVDVTARRQAEEEVRSLNAELERRVVERTAQLAAANQELEAFCYSVSHDLRAPLRAIDGFSKAILEDSGPLLDPEGLDALHRVRAATQRMGELIDDLLQLSRVTRAEMHFAPVDLSGLARRTAEGLHAQAPQRAVIWNIEPGRTVQGDAALLRVVLENLLGNAWKYTSGHPAGVITFAQQAGDPPVFYVRDDGAGFDPAHSSRLFQPFQRLHRIDEFDGHGIGLATVQRIIHRHGGRVWAEGAVEKGATFYFTL